MDTVEFDGRLYLHDRSSDPRELGLMRGAPPPADKRITFEGDAFFWLSADPLVAIAHAPTRGHGERVPRGRRSFTSRSPNASQIDVLTFTDANGRTRRFDQALFDTYADGVVVLHRGRIVSERYFGEPEPHLPYACMSVPELRGKAFEDATLRQVMDMQVGLAYTEVYVDERSSVWDHLEHAAYDWLATTAREHLAITCAR